MDKFEELQELLRADRSVRRFDESRRVCETDLRAIVELTRYCASGRNMQPLKYRIVCDPAECDAVFPMLAWAGYLADWAGPEMGERPVAYIVQCLDTQYGENLLCDDGLHLQAITLGATAKGIGACIIKSFNVAGVVEKLGLADGLKPLYVLALGYPVERVEIEDTDGSADADIKYYRTADGVHHVPKRPLSELLVIS